MLAPLAIILSPVQSTTCSQLMTTNSYSSLDTARLVMLMAVLKFKLKNENFTEKIT